TWREESRAEFDARGLAMLEVTNSRGLVTVSPSRDGRIHLTALKIARSNDKSRSLRYARETTVLHEVRDGALVLQVRYPQRQSENIGLWQLLHGGFEFPHIEVRLAIEAPAELAIVLSSTSGDLETDGIAGEQ